MQTHTFTLGKHRTHFYIGTPGLMNIHTLKNIYQGDHLVFNSTEVMVVKVITQKDSIVYKGHNYYELKTKRITPLNN